MKNLIVTAIILCSASAAFSQSDTIYTRKNEKIPCKILEISETEIRYKMTGLEDGPNYLVNKSTVLRYRLSNGFTESIIPDELSLEHEHGSILKNRTVIKMHPFSFVNNQLSFAFEKVIKVGMNLDIEAGYSNSNINSTTNLTGNSIYNGNPFNAGAYIKPGLKFFLGQDFSVKGLKYAHPLKGRYVKLDLACSFINFHDLMAYKYSYQPNPGPIVTQTVVSDMSVMAYGGFVNYGRQFILGNILTMEYYLGVGFTGLSYTYSNPEYSKAINSMSYSYYNEAGRVSNFHGFLRTPGFGLSITGGFRIGYIIPEPRLKPKSRPLAN